MPKYKLQYLYVWFLTRHTVKFINCTLFDYVLPVLRYREVSLKCLNVVICLAPTLKNQFFSVINRSGTTIVCGTSRDWGSPPDRGTPYLNRDTPKLSSWLCRKQFPRNFNYKVNNFSIALELPVRLIYILNKDDDCGIVFRFATAVWSCRGEDTRVHWLVLM